MIYQPGTNQCSACHSSAYCGVNCQKADWAHHKEECPGHLRKVGLVNLFKAHGFHEQQNWLQTLRFAVVAATKLKQLKDRRLETVSLINDALVYQFNALKFLSRLQECMECAKERYTLWAMNHLRDSGSIYAAFALIESCLFNKEYEDAERYARHAYFMIAEMTDNFIPVNEKPQFIAEVSYWLSIAIHRLAVAGGIPPEEKEKVGKEAIEHARKSLEMHTQLEKEENNHVANVMAVLANVLNHFNVDDDEVLRLQEQAIVLFRRLEGDVSVNVAVHEDKLGILYATRALRAQKAHDINRCLSNYDLAMTHYRESARNFRAINQVEEADGALRKVASIEVAIRRIEIARAAAALVTRR